MRARATTRPAAPEQLGEQMQGAGYALCLIKFIRGNKTVSRDCAEAGGEGRPGPAAGPHLPGSGDPHVSSQGADV